MRWTLPLLLAACTSSSVSLDLVAITPRSPTTSDDLEATVRILGADAPASSADLREAGFAWRWLVDGEPVDVDGLSVPADRTEVGQGWTLEVSSTQVLEASTASVVIANSPPEASVFLVPTRADEDLVATVVASDPDGDAVDTTLVWRLDGEVQPDLLEPLVPRFHTARDDVWSLEVTVEDPRGAQATAEAAVTIGNSVPRAFGVRILPALPSVGDTLTGVASIADWDDDPVEATWTWSVDGTVVVPAGNHRFETSGLAMGDAITATVVLDDGFDASEPITSDPVTLAEASP